jgi:hypothetical protein
MVMGAIMVTLYSRYSLRPGADRGQLGQAALNSCRVQKSREGCLDARYHWVDPNTVVILSTFDGPSRIFPADSPPEDAAKSMFSLADLADRTAWELWFDAQSGMQSLRAAGRDA